MSSDKKSPRLSSKTTKKSSATTKTNIHLLMQSNIFFWVWFFCIKSSRVIVAFSSDQAVFFHGCKGGGSKLGAGGGSFGSKYQSARYKKMPGNAALKSVPKTQTTRSFDDGRSKCFANPPQTPAIRRSSCERLSFIMLQFIGGASYTSPHFPNHSIGQGLSELVPPNFGDGDTPSLHFLWQFICPCRHPSSSPFSARGPVPAISRTSRRSELPTPVATG
jgi:hypothetical protein